MTIFYVKIDSVHSRSVFVDPVTSILSKKSHTIADFKCVHVGALMKTE
jgi:hypothetical protein